MPAAISIRPGRSWTHGSWRLRSGQTNEESAAMKRCSSWISFFASLTFARGTAGSAGADHGLPGKYGSGLHPPLGPRAWTTKAGHALPNPTRSSHLRLQKQHGLPRVDAGTGSGVCGGASLEQWAASTDHLIVSHVRHREEADGSAQRPDPSSAPPGTAAGASTTPGLQCIDLVRSKTLEDVHGLPLEPGEHRGGTGRIRDQASCPFRGYAIHRLNLKEARQPRGLPDALDRGILVHEALHRLYEHASKAGQARRRSLELAVRRRRPTRRWRNTMVAFPRHSGSVSGTA